ncbi:valine--tRNA ligase [Candidatus Epulonipiscium fishelsonii]|uniref:Valine--tRNA ligase n=1 Tax=Candidatus Epulonipiscium fishelsonii TaxID=77094 RepID=A0ACC8XFX9_9FIRM|nr:valine--tRNA ligase [Epulopiscium sp. SCG-B11WGA-EpuloA1]ONI42856.1 valine--tRNA ligase [Epulopiscium sp. SCG-B05WGA-EpuloA1]
MEKIYNPKTVEEKLYKKWMDKGYFKAEVDKTKKPYSMMMPPPNITGQLHMGHALNNTLQDILTRFKRMQGYNALWMPGTDHASIATEVKVANKILDEEGISKAELGRDKFLERVWEWKEESGGIIVEQLKKLGASCDWDRICFTMDKGLSEGVTKVFINLYNKGYIYRGARIVNWCPKCKTAISEAEVEYKEIEGNFYHLRYPIVGTNKFINLATTRPETMLGDTAVAVNPKDDRYKDLVGKMVKLPLTDREIPIIADEYVDMDFGTGVVKITPAHDPNDFEVGQRHNLEQLCIMTDEGIITEGKYKDLSREEARVQVLKDLEEQGFLIKIEPHIHNVGTHDRCKTIIEPMIKDQWFVKMAEMAKPAIEAVKSGEMKFVPERFGNTYLRWLENIRDWCISRQLWWGHRIPAYYCQNCNEIIIASEKPETCKCGKTDFVQEDDVLDTWFSSALWPFSTLGWPNETPELEYFYPTSVLVTAYDIIFFWVVRMAFSGIEQMGEIPFKDVFIHGLVRDSEGQKMSKSLGNGIDPLEIINQYGADALRLTLVTGNAPGNDMRFYYERVEANRNFGNKLWNATRFILMNCEGETIDLEKTPADLTSVDKWILSKINSLAQEVTHNMDKYELGIAVQKIYEFAWEEFCDWYIEMVKPRLYNVDDTTRYCALWTLKKVMIDIVKLLHPYIPFITEEIFMSLQEAEESIMISDWPTFKSEFNFEKEEQEIELIKVAVRNIRNVRSQMNVPPSVKAKVYVVSEDNAILSTFEKGKLFFATLGFASEVLIQNNNKDIPNNAVSVVIPNALIYIPMSELVDIEKEKERLNKEKIKLEKEVERVDKKLSNQGFVAKAPQNVIEEEKAKKEKYQAMLNEVIERINNLI